MKRIKTVSAIVVGLLVLCVIAFQQHQIRRMRDQNGTLLQMVLEDRDTRAREAEAPLRDLAAQIVRARQDNPAPAAPAAAVAPPTPVMTPDAGTASQASADEAKQNALLAKSAEALMEHLRTRPSRLNNPDWRRDWVHGFSSKAGLSPQQSAEIAGLLDAERDRVADIVQQQSAGIRTPIEARNDLIKLHTENMQRVRRILDGNQFTTYMNDRVALNLEESKRGR